MTATQSEIEFCQYVEPGTGRLLHRTVIKRERTSSTVWNTVEIHMTVEATELARADFSAVDFDMATTSTAE